MHTNDFSAIREQGWCKLESGLTRAKLDSLSIEFEEYFHRHFKNRRGNIAELQAKDIPITSEIDGVYNTLSNIFLAIDGALLFKKLWLVRSENHHSDPSKLPYIPHIDRRRFIKAMLYLDDVTEQDGPLHIAKLPPSQFETLRLSLADRSRTQITNRIAELPEHSFAKCTGRAGTVVLFDTNCPHYAGLVGTNRVRRVLRFDYEKPEWNNLKPALTKASRKIRNLWK